MKKWLPLCLLLLLAFSLCACRESNPPVSDGSETTISGECDFPEIPEEIVRQIRQTYYDSHREEMGDATPDHVEITAYYGEYHGAYAVVIFDKWRISISAVVEKKVNGLLFIYPSPHSSVSIYRDGTLYGVQTAFERGVLSAEDLQELYETYKAAWPEMYAEEDVRNAYYEAYVRGTEAEKTVKPEQLQVRVYGSFSDGIAAVVEGHKAVYPQKSAEIVGEIEFRYDTDLRILFFSGKGILTLSEAYEQRLLSTPGLRQIARIHHTYHASLYKEDWTAQDTVEFTAIWESEVKRLYLEQYDYLLDRYGPDDLTVTCYGNYLYGYAVSVETPDMFWLWEHWENGYYLTTPDSNGIWFYRNGELTPLESAELPDYEWTVLQNAHRECHPEYYWAYDLCQGYYDRFIAGTPKEDTVRPQDLSVSAIYENNGCIAGIVRDNTPAEKKTWHETAGNSLFRYDTEDRLVFLENGEVHTLDELGKNGLTFGGDLQQLLRWYQDCRPDLYGSPFVRDCSDALAREILQAYFDAGRVHSPYLTVDDLILEYYGAFEGGHAVSIAGNPTTDGGGSIVLEGLRFDLTTPLFYRDGEFYTLKRARKLGILSAKGLVRIHASYTN